MQILLIKTKQDLVFSVKLHLAISPYSFGLYPFGLDRPITLNPNTLISGVWQQFRCCFGLPGRCAKSVGEMCMVASQGKCAKVAGEMCKGAKVKSTPSPRPKTGVWQYSSQVYVCFSPCLKSNINKNKNSHQNPQQLEAELSLIFSFSSSPTCPSNPQPIHPSKFIFPQ